MGEGEALQRLKRGDRQALMWFIHRYSAYVSTIVFNIIGTFAGNSDLEEISADVFVVFWQNAERVQPEKARSYLAAVARNKAKAALRRTGGTVPLEEDAILIAQDDPEREISERETTMFLRNAILAMQYPEREIFLRHYYYYQPLAQIAEEMDMNLSTVKTKLRRGRQKLKEVLEQGGYSIET